MTFEHALDHDTLNDMITTHLAAARIPTAPFDLSNEKYEPGDSVAYQRWVLRIQLPEAEAREKLFKPIQDELARQPYFPSSSSIGGKVAGDMQEKATYALLASLISMVIYLWVRFQKVMYGVAAALALVHDVLVTLGAVAVSAYVAPYLGFLMIDPFKISLSVLAAFLTIVGFSVNDTIVIFDRMRELRGKSPILTTKLVNASINQTLSRTLLTTMSVLSTVAILYVGGGQGIHVLAFSLLVGFVAGTYSTVFIASPILLWMERPAKSSRSGSRS